VSPSFSVGATVRRVNGGGHLIIERGSLVLKPGALTRRLSGVDRIAHAVPAVHLIRGRLLPPWMNAHLVITDGQETGLAGIPAWTRGRVVRQLQASGFTVEESVTLFSRGASEVASGS
jgi:hypothetical protein